MTLGWLAPARVAGQPEVVNRATSRRRRTLIVLAGLSALVVVAVVLAAQRQEPIPSPLSTVGLTSPAPTAAPSASPAPSAAPSASASPTTAGAFENRVLGYRITFPAGYRRSSSRISTGDANALGGGDYYTRVTEQAARDQCQRDGGDVGSFLPEQGTDVSISVSRSNGMTARQYATTPQVPGGQPPSTHHRVEGATIGGHDAVRLVTDNAAAETTSFVIAANDRIYWISRPVGIGEPPSRTWLEDIARTFVAFAPAPFPSPTPSTPPRDAARQVADTLVQAFEKRDADAIARVLPSCWLNVTAVRDGQPTGGVLYRSVTLFTEALRGHFARGDITVTIDPTVRVRTTRHSDDLYVRSSWRYPDATVEIDMYIRVFDGRPELFVADHKLSGSAGYRSPFAATR